MDSVVYLISENRQKDAAGVFRKEETKRRVFCDVRSVGAQEFFGGGRNGLNPELVVILFHADYNGARIVEYEGKRYSVYRTFFGGRTSRNANYGPDYMELYLERKGGTNGEEND